MTRQEINERLNGVFAEVFDDDTITVSDNTTAKDIEDWDSLAHLTLMSSIEEEFGVEFSLGEINSFTKVGDLMDCIEKKI